MKAALSPNKSLERTRERQSAKFIRRRARRSAQALDGMIDVGATLEGDCAPWPTIKNLAAILSSAGLDVAILTFTVHVRNCGRFFFEYDGTPAGPFIRAESETPELMCENASLVSATLTAAGVLHRFEVLDLDGNRVAYLHHEWPMPSNPSQGRTRDR